MSKGLSQPKKIVLALFSRFKKITEGDVPHGTSGASACLLGTDMYVFGGHQSHGNTNKLYKLDLVSMVWEEIISPHGMDSVPSPRDKLICWSYKNK